jgi:hypothetical protein
LGEFNVEAVKYWQELEDKYRDALEKNDNVEEAERQFEKG